MRVGMARTRQEGQRATDFWCGIAIGRTYWIEGIGAAKPLDPQELEQRSLSGMCCLRSSMVLTARLL